MDSNFNKRLEEAIKTGMFDQIECNNDEERSLLEAGKKIYQAKFKAIPADNGFKNALFDRLKQARQGEREKMEKEMTKGWQVDLFSFFTKRKWAVGIASFLLVAIVASLLYWLPGVKETTGGILIPRAQADEMFTFKPTKADSIGIDEESDFTLTSQIDLKLADVQNNLKVDPDFKFEIKEISSREFLIDSQEKLNPKQIYKFTLQTTTQAENILESKDFAWAYQVKNQFQIEGTLPRNLSNGVLTNTGIEITFSHENFESIEDYFSIEPAVTGKFEKHWRTMVFVPDGLQAATMYTVKIKKGLPLTGTDQKLADDYVFKFETKGEYSDRSGDFSFADRLVQFQADQRQIVSLNRIYLEDDNTKEHKLPIKIFQFEGVDSLIDYLKEKADYPDWLWYSREREEIYDTSQMQKLGDFSVPVLSQTYNYFVNFVELPVKLENGYYLVEAEMNGFTHQLAVEVTDLSVYETINKDKTLFWAWNIKNQSPINEAQVRLENYQDLGNTNQDGILEIETPEVLKKTYEDFEQFYITVRSEEQVLVLTVNPQRGWGWHSLKYEQAAADYWRYIYFDRSTYKPTDKIKFWGTLTPRNAEVPAINQTTVSLEKWDYYSDDTVLGQKTVEVKENYLSGEMDLVNVPVGFYDLVFREGDREIDRRSINIVDYIKPAYELKVSADKQMIVSGDEVKFSVKANFFEGTPVPNLNLSYEAYGDISGEITTDQKGEASWSMKLEKQVCTLESWSCQAELNLITVRPMSQLEEGEIVGTTGVKVFSADYFLRENQTDQSGQENQVKKQISVQVKKLDLAKINEANESSYGYYNPDYPGQAVANYPINIKVTDEWWEKTETGQEYDFISKQTIKKYEYNSKTEIFWEGEAKTDDQGNYVFSVEQPEDGHMYSMTVSLKDEAQRLFKDVYYLRDDSYGYSPFDGYRDMYNLKYDAPKDQTGTKKYKLGEKVQVEMIKNRDTRLEEQPNKRFLFVHYQNGLQDYSLSTISRHEFIFGEKQIPNVYVEGLYFDGTRINSTVSPLHWDNFKYDYSEKEIDLTVSTDKSNYLPGETAKLRIVAKDKNNQPVQTAGNISLVDEAYYNLFEDSVNIGETLFSEVEEGNISRGFSHESYFKIYYQGGGCFAGETNILLADGSKKTIEEIAIGEQIQTLTAPDKNTIVFDRVVGKVKHLVGGYLLINNQLKVTPVHRLLINGQWLTAAEAKVGDKLMDAAGGPVTIYSIEKIYQPTVVYNLTTEKTHTFIADGFYVHNAKGSARESFEDTAAFSTWKTDRNGQVTVEIQLPDNLTSWRMITQTVDEKQNFGKKVDNLIVKQPIRGEIVMNNRYLVGDKPIITMRVYGEDLKGDENIKAVVTSESLKIKEVKTVKPFEDFEVQISDLDVGNHDLVLAVTSGDLEDSIKKTFSVQESYLTKKQSRYFDLNQTTNIPVEIASNRSQIKIMNKDVSRFYQILNSVYWQNGERIDQLAAAKSAGKLLQDYWQESYPPIEFDSAPYQREDGGISLLPYSDSDLGLSTLITMSSTKENFNQELMKKYFIDIANNKLTNTGDLTKALCGLAGLGEPVLNQINALNANQKLETKDRLYLAIALEEMGAKELAKSILQKILDTNLKNGVEESYVAIGGEQDNLEATKLAAIVAMATGQKDREQMLNFLEQKATEEQPMWLIMTAYIESAKKQDIPLTSQVEVKWNNGQKKVKIKGYETAGFNLTSEEMKSLQIKLIQGSAAAVVIDDIPARLEDFDNNSELNVRREYWVNDKKTENVKAGDVVEVRIYPEATNVSGSYLIRDILPSGLKPLTRTYNYNLDKDIPICSYYHPTAITGQKVDLMIWSDWPSSFCGKEYINYQARVMNKGEFVVEPVSIKSNKDIKQVSVEKSDFDVLKIE